MNSGMEPEVKNFLMKILQTISSLILWAVVCIFLGLYLEWAIVHYHFNTFNIIFYAWFIISFVALIYYFFRIWKK